MLLFIHNKKGGGLNMKIGDKINFTIPKGYDYPNGKGFFEGKITKINKKSYVVEYDEENEYHRRLVDKKEYSIDEIAKGR